MIGWVGLLTWRRCRNWICVACPLSRRRPSLRKRRRQLPCQRGAAGPLRRFRWTPSYCWKACRGAGISRCQTATVASSAEAAANQNKHLFSERQDITSDITSQYRIVLKKFLVDMYYENLITEKNDNFEQSHRAEKCKRGAAFGHF